MFPPWKIEAPIISPGPYVYRILTESRLSGEERKNIGDDLCVLCMCDRNRRRDGDSTTHTRAFFFFFFLWPVYEGAHMVPLASDQAQKILMCIRRLVFSSLGLCVCVCTYSLVSPSFSFSRMRSRVLQTSSSLFHPSPVNMKSDNNNNTQKGIGGSRVNTNNMSIEEICPCDSPPFFLLIHCREMDKNDVTSGWGQPLRSIHGAHKQKIKRERERERPATSFNPLAFNETSNKQTTDEKGRPSVRSGIKNKHKCIVAVVIIFE